MSDHDLIVSQFLTSPHDVDPVSWDPGFDVDRQIVQAKIGPFQWFWERPKKKFTPRFYHHLYDLPVEDWHYHETLSLFEGFCQLDVMLQIKFQATVDYAKQHIERLPQLNAHIKTAYATVIQDIVQQAVETLHDGRWVQTGLVALQQRIAQRINETLLSHGIQAQSFCQMRAKFAEFPDTQPGPDSVYLNVLKKTYETNEAKVLERYRQQQEEARLQLAQQKQLAELEKERQIQSWMQQQALLAEQLKHQSQQFELERQLRQEQAKHEAALQEIAYQQTLQSQARQQIAAREAELQTLPEQLQHEALISEQRTRAEIARTEQAKALWRDAEHRQHELQLALTQQQKQRELEAEIQYEQLRQRHYMTLLQEENDASRQTDGYLRRNIARLQLEKQRLDLEIAVQEARRKLKSLLE